MSTSDYEPPAPPGSTLADALMAAGETKQAMLVIFSSPHGRGEWTLVKPEDVPEWVKDPDNMARLVEGETCMKCDEGETGSLWYCAMPVDDAVRFQQANLKRLRKAERNRSVH